MKGRKGPQLRITWVEQWVPGLVLENLGSHHRREWEAMTSSQVSVVAAANNTNTVVSKSNFVISAIFSVYIFFCLLGQNIEEKVLSFGVLSLFIHPSMDIVVLRIVLIVSEDDCDTFYL